MHNSVKYNLNGILIGVLATGASYLIALPFGWFDTNDPYLLPMILAVFTSYWATYLCVFESRWNYPIGFVSTLLYAYVFWQSGLYASAITNVYLPIALVYGFFRWGPDGNPRPVTRVKSWEWVFLYFPLVVASVALVAFLLIQFRATVGWQDAAILVLTVLAQWLLDNKKLETWIVWAAVNIFAIYVYSTQGLWLFAIQYVLFLANTVWGYYTWQNSKYRSELNAFLTSVWVR